MNNLTTKQRELLQGYLAYKFPKLVKGREKEVIDWMQYGLYPGTLEFLLDFLKFYNIEEDGAFTHYANNMGVSRQTVSERFRRIEARIKKAWGKK